MLVCADDDVAALLELEELLSVVADAFRRQGRGEVERPERPHFPIGTGVDGDESLGTGLTMPAYLHGDETYATKLVSVIRCVVVVRHPVSRFRRRATATAKCHATNGEV